MSRYTINIGDDFPLNDDRPGAASRRWGFGLRALFALAVAVIVLSHPFHAVLLLGLALVLRRSSWLAEARARWRQRAGERREAWGRWNQGCGPRGHRGGNDNQQRDDRREDRTKAFV